MSKAEDWCDYPMGPTLRSVLKIEDIYSGDQPGARDRGSARDEFSEFLVEYLGRVDLDDPKKFVALIEECVKMDLCDLALKLPQMHPGFEFDQDFRVHLALGSAAMRTGDLERAEVLLVTAQSLAPEEVAPYVNLATLYFHSHRDDDSLDWAMAGLDVDPCSSALWEQIAALYQVRFREGAGEELRRLATQRQGWPGLCLAAQLIDARDMQLTAELLAPVYQAGERSQEFLIEYTAALGQAEKYELIPQICWESERLQMGASAWQLYVHAGQAHLALEQKEQAKDQFARALLTNKLPEEMRNQLQEFVNQLLSDNGGKDGDENGSQH